MPGIAETDAFARLTADWGIAYQFSRDPGSPEPYRAERCDGRGGLLTAPDPDALRSKVLRDYLEHRVPREVAP